MSQPLLARVGAAIAEHRLLREGQPVLIGLSGGVDSTCLLHALRELGYAVQAAHLDHGLRPESARDADWVRDLCASWQIPLVAERVATPLAVGEQAAREARLAFLARVALERGIDAVALGHHADDQAETVLFRIARGSGPAGLAGMAWQRELAPGIRLIRPLLGLRRKELEAAGLPALVDASNADLAFARNRIRHEVLPALEAAVPGAAENLAAFAALMRDEASDRQETARRRANLLVHEVAPGVVEVDRQALLGLPLAEARWLLREAAARLGTTPFAAAALARCLAVAASGGAAELAGGWRVAATPSWLVLRGESFGPEPRPYMDLGLQPTADWGWRVDVRAGSSGEAGNVCRVSFDARALPGNLVWRSARPDEDRIQPWGGERPLGLRGFLTRQGIPAHRQESLLVLASGKTLAWVVGVRRGSLAPVANQATEVVEMQATARFRV